MVTFEKTADRHRGAQLLQMKAADKLMALLDVRGNEDVLDIACGQGHVTAALASKTGGRVVGIDISAGAIEQARKRYPGVEFRQSAVEDLDYSETFDALFCSSCLNWFSQPSEALRIMHRALKKGGRFALSCPATMQWSPLFLEVIKQVASQPDIYPVFSRWRNPWFFLPTQNDAQRFLESIGFSTVSIAIEYETGRYTPEEIFRIYRDNIAIGFENRDFYCIPVDDEYIARFHRRIGEEIRKKVVNGKVLFDCNRLYYLGKK